MMTIAIGEDRIGVAEVVAVARRGAAVMLAPAAAGRLDQARAVLEDWSRQDRAVYGLTRGLGNRAAQTIPLEERAGFSETALKGRATGAGGYFETEVARAALFVRAATLARGGAGVRPVIVETQLAMLAAGVTPLIPRIGSVGTSDLLLCANLGLPIIGLGRAEHGGEVLAGAEAMARAGVATVTLTEKEGLALCSANAVSVGYGALVAHDVHDLLALADAVLAMSYEAFAGNPSPFDARVAAARPAAGQEQAAAALRRMLAGSSLFEPGVPRRVQDPISFRCATQVHGTVRAALGWAEQDLEVELNATADNPLILAEDGEIVSTGNFHTALLAVAFDALRLALAQLGSQSSERCARLMDPELSGLPSRLTRHGVTRAGVGLVGMVARTLSRESRHCSAPCSNDDVTPMGVEDQAPFTLQSVRRTADQLGFLRQALACEMIVAAQALDLRPPARLPPVVAALHGFIRRHVAFVDDDRSTTEDVEALAAAVDDGAALACVHSALEV
ncbi:MAG TPA: aromatic amino acid lyase [Caulobacteraceae bacterium]|jgi:histidine ammonia-lyase|nr:aromatic amino acid lyase [Caulobacteraceae bacterium]